MQRFARMCPACTREAPLVYRGFSAYCAACGARRTVLSASSVTHAGKVQRVGASLFFAAGFAVFAIIAIISAFFGLLVGLIGTATAGLVTFGVGVAIGLVLLLVSWLGARKVRQSGDDSASERLRRALYEAAALRGGVVTANELGPLLSMPTSVLDEELASLAKHRHDEVAADVDDRGAVVYRFFRLLEVKPTGRTAGGPWVQPAERPRVRVEHVPPASRQRSSSDDASSIVDAEFEMIDDEAAASKKKLSR